MIRVAILFLLPAIAFAAETPNCVGTVFRSLFLNGSGPIIASLCIEHKHGQARAILSSRNHSGWPIQARFCVRGQNRTNCAFEFWTTETWEPSDPLEASQAGPWQKGLNEPEISLEWLQRIVPKLRGVSRIYVAPIEGDDGAMARDQIIATLANHNRFEIVNSEELADAVIEGRSEVRIGPTVTSSSAEARQTGVGSIGGMGSRTGAVLGGVSVGRAKEKSTSSTETLTGKALVLHLVLRSGETVWGWDDTSDCRSELKTKCAVEDLVASAGTYNPK